MWNHAIVDTGPSGLALYAAAYAAMLAIPGPSFMIVSQASLSASRRALRPALQPGRSPKRALRGGYFAMGLLTALTNPISFSFFSGVALASRTGGDLDGTLMSAGVFAIALVWFGCLAMLLSHPAMQSLYGRASRRLDAVTGAILVAIALSWLVRGG